MKEKQEVTEARYFCKECKQWVLESDFDLDEYECKKCDKLEN